MSTIRCPQCKLVSWASDQKCKRCGLPFHPGSPMPDGGMRIEEPVEVAPAAVSEQPPELAARPAVRAEPNSYGNPLSAAKPKTGLAVFSMISGIIGMPPFSTLGGAFVGAILGLVFGAAGFVVGLLLVFASIPAGLIAGVVSLRRANRLPSEYGGRGFALAGIICSSIALLILPVIAAIAIPNLLASRRAANEGAAILTVRKLASAEDVFMRDLGSGHCGDLNIMVGVGLIDKTLEKGEKSGYRFQISNYPDRGCEIHAMPLSSSTGERSFLFSTKDGHMRAAARNGKPADKDDPALDPALHVDIDRQPTKVASGRNL